jgi:type IV pilus assembly protein PilA
MEAGIWQGFCINTQRVSDRQSQPAAGTVKQQGGFSLIELLIVVAIILIIASIAIPSLINTKIVANEAAAVATLNTIRSAEATYIAQYPEVGFADSLEKLGPPATPSAQPDATHAGLLDEVLAIKKSKSGYNYQLAGAASGTPPIVHSYTATASYQSTTTGRSNFCMNETGVVRAQSGGTACDPATSSPVQ